MVLEENGEDHGQSEKRGSAAKSHIGYLLSRLKATGSNRANSIKYKSKCVLVVKFKGLLILLNSFLHLSYSETDKNKKM